MATSRDIPDIKKIYLSAFPNNENEIVAKLAINLLDEDTAPQTISLLAETNALVVGHIAFSPVKIDKNKDVQAFILAPLAVHPDYQNRYVGSMLIEHGMQQLATAGVDIIFVYGDPKYYSKYGFNADVARHYTTPYKLQYPFGWQAASINKFSAAGAPVAINCVKSLSDPKLW